MTQTSEPTGTTPNLSPLQRLDKSGPIDESIWRLMFLAWSIVPRRHMWFAAGVFLLSAISGLIDLAGIGSIFLFTATAVQANEVANNKIALWIADELSLKSSDQLLIALGIISVVLIILRNIVMFAEGAAQNLFRFSVERSLAYNLLQRYVYQPISFFQDVNTSDLSRNILIEIRRVTGYLLEFLVMGSGLIGTTIIIAGVIKEVHQPALIAFGAIALFYGLLYFAMRRLLVRLGHLQYTYNGHRFVAAAQTLVSVRESKLYGVEPEFLKRFDSASRVYLLSLLNSRLLNLVPRHSLEIIVALGFAAIVATQIDATGGIAGALSGLVLVITAFYRIMPRIDALIRSVLNLKVTNAAVINIVEALKMPVEGIDRRPDTTQLALGRGIRLDDVTFHYSGAEKPAVCNITLELPSKGLVGIVGPSGAGKSTLVELITGLLPPSHGEIYVDGRLLDRSLMASWRASIAYVAQDPAILDDDIYANIAFGLPSDKVDLQALRAAAQLAQIDEFICELPEGYRTRVGENGSKLSGGQRQRIALARALIRNAQLIILDEATNALDAKSEHAIIEAVRRLGQDRLVLVIAHGHAFVRVCDKVVCLEDGAVRAVGAYSELFDGNRNVRDLGGELTGAASEGALARGASRTGG